MLKKLINHATLLNYNSNLLEVLEVPEVQVAHPFQVYRVVPECQHHPWVLERSLIKTGKYCVELWQFFSNILHNFTILTHEGKRISFLKE